MGGWSVDVGGALAVHDDTGRALELRPKERAIVAAIALVHPSAASIADVVELVWADAPDTARKSVHNHVARLRQRADGLVETVDGGGYRLGDAVVIRSPRTDDVFADLVDHPEVAIARTRFRDLRLRGEERDAAASLPHRPTDDEVGRLVALAEAEPHRLERWRLVVMALARRGRRLAALELLRRARREAAGTADEHRRLDLLEAAVLHDDPRLDVDDYLLATADAPGDTRGDGASSDDDLFVDVGDVLGRLLQRIETGATGSVALVGAAGSGKTTIAARARARAIAAGWECHRIEARSHASSSDHVVNSLWRSLAERAGGEDLRATATASIADCESMLNDGRRRFIVLDDVHHTSRDEIEAIDELVTRTATHTNVLWLIACRHQLDVETDTRLDVEPWDTDAVHQLLLRFVAPSPWLDGAASWIASEAHGNALAVRELAIDAVRRRSSTTSRDGAFAASLGGAAPIDWVRRRVDRLGAVARRGLAGAAMIGVEFDLATLGSFAPDPVGVAASARLDGVITPVPGAPRRFRFAHDLFRDVLLDELDEELRAELALIALRDPMFDGDEESRRRSMLARVAVRDDPRRAIVETIDAAELEHRRRHPVEAERLYRRAIELIERHDDPADPSWLAARLGLGSVAVSNGRADAASILLECASIAADAGHGEIGARAVYEASRIGLASSVGRSDTDVARAIGRLRDVVDDPTSRTYLDMSEMAVYGIATDGARARALLDSAMHAADESGDPDLAATVRRSAYMAVLRPDDLPARRSIADDLRRRGEDVGDATLIYEARRLDFSIAVEAGEADPRPILADLERMYHEFNERSRNWSLFAFRCVVAYLDGDLAAVQRGIDRIMSDEVAVSQALKLSTAGGHLVGLHLARGDLQHLDPVVAAIEADIPELPVWIAARAATAAAAGDHATAAARLAAARCERDGRPALDLPDDFTGVPTAYLIGEAARLIGDADTLALATQTLQRHRGLWIWHGTGTLGPVDLALARWAATTGDDAAAVALARSALESAARVGAPHVVSSAAELISAHSGGTRAER